MFKRINWRAVFNVFAWLVSLGGLVTLMSFIEVEKSRTPCTDVKVIIPGTAGFIERPEVDRIIFANQGPLTGKMLYSVNIHQIENALKENPYIEHARVFSDMNGVITIKVQQRRPLLRVINLTNQDFYIDRNGLKIPTSLNFSARVLPANGFIMEGFAGQVDTLKTPVAEDLYKAALFIEKDTLWNRQIEQLYVNQQEEIEMIPRVGDHVIILGDADSLDKKFKKLLLFYKRVLPKAGWGTYKTINVKYANQIVCERSNRTDSIIKALAVEAKRAAASDTVKKIVQDTSIIVQ